MNRIHRFVPIAALAVAAACHHGGAASAPATPKMPDGVTSKLIAQGDSILATPNVPCMRCHGAGLAGGQNAPSLVMGPWLQSAGTFPELTAIVISGVPKDKIKDTTHRFAMNPTGGPMNLTDDQARAVAAYVWSISRAKTKPAS